jgi:acetyl-CoA synthetase
MRIAQEAIDRHAAHGHGDQQAITWLDKKGERIKLTYSTLDSLSNQFANLLAKLGVEPGDRVYSLVSPNSFLMLKMTIGYPVVQIFERSTE